MDDDADARRRLIRTGRTIGLILLAQMGQRGFTHEQLAVVHDFDVNDAIWGKVVDAFEEAVRVKLG